MSDRPRFTGDHDCGHCGNSVRMEIVADYSQVATHEDERSGIQWDAGPIHELIKCPACRGISLRYCYYHDSFLDDLDYQVVYPEGRSGPIGLPRKLSKAYDAALRVRDIDPNAYGVLLGRVLELVCDDRGASGRSLNDRLAMLAERQEIPDKLVKVASSLRQLRNVGAHASLGELTPGEVPILDDLCRALLEYVYSAPHLVQQAEARIKRLRGKTNKAPRKRTAKRR